MRYENNGNGFQETRARIRVQTSAGIAYAGQLVFSYNADNETVEIRNVRVLKPDGSSIMTGPENVQDLSAPVAQTAPVYSDARQKHVTVAGLSVGDTIEYDVVLKSKPLVPGQFWHSNYLVSRSICLDEQVELDVPRNRPLKMKGLPGVTPKVKDDGDRRIYLWKTSNLTVPKPVQMLKNFQINVRQLLEGTRPGLPPHVAFSTFQQWNEVGKWYAELDRDRSTPTPVVRSQADEIVRGKNNDTEKAQALYEWVARNIRYVSLSFGVGRYQAHPAADVLANNYGDCKDKITLLEAFFAAEGIPINAALVNASSEFDLDVPTPQAFDHVIALASVAGKQIWLDPTTGVGAFGYLMPQLRSQRALVVSTGAGPAILQTPKDLVIPTLAQLDVSGTVNKDGNLDAIVKFSIRGDLEVLLRLLNSILPPAQYSAFVLEAMTNGNKTTYGQSAFTDFRLEEVGDISKPLRGQFHFVGKLDYVNLQATSPGALVSGADAALLAKASEIGWPANNSTDDFLTPAGDLAGPKEYSLNVTVTVPDVNLTGSEKPIANHLASDFGDYQSNVAWDGKTLHADWRLSLRSAIVSPLHAKDDLEFKNNVMGTLKGEPPKIEVTKKISQPSTANSGMTSPAHSAVPEAEDLFKQGQSEAKLENYANAVNSFNAALKIDPKYPDAWRELGRSYMFIRDYANAEAAFRKYLSLSPDDHLAYLNIAWVLYIEKKYSEEVGLLEKRLENAPGDGDAQTRLGTAYVALHEADRAVPHLERAVRIFPKYQAAYYTLGLAYLDTHQDAKAAATLQSAIDLDPTDTVLNSAAYQLAQRKSSLAAAEKWSRQAINEVQIESNQVTLQTPPLRLATLAQRLSMYWDTLGWVKFQQGDYPIAEKYIFAAWQMRGDSTIGTHLAHVYAAQGRREEAIEIYSEVVKNLSPQRELTEDEKDAGKQLATLRSGSPLQENLTASAHERLGSLRVVKIENAAQAQGIAQYLLLIGPASDVIDMAVIGSDGGLAKSADAIRSTVLPQSFPDSSLQKIARVATLACLSPTQPCTLTLTSTSSAERILPASSE